MNSFFVVGHDRGGRVAHRMALDHPESVKKMMILDIAPTLWMYDHTNMVFVRVPLFPQIQNPNLIQWSARGIAD